MAAGQPGGIRLAPALRRGDRRPARRRAGLADAAATPTRRRDAGTSAAELRGTASGAAARERDPWQQLDHVESARGAVLVLPPARFPGPLAEPAVPISR